MKRAWAIKHHELLQLMLNLDLSKSTILRIVDGVNALVKDPEVCMAKTERYINLLKECETESDVIQRLDEAGL